jgi:hypothetical protein
VRAGRAPCHADVLLEIANAPKQIEDQEVASLDGVQS